MAPPFFSARISVLVPPRSIPILMLLTSFAFLLGLDALAAHLATRKAPLPQGQDRGRSGRRSRPQPRQLCAYRSPVLGEPSSGGLGVVGSNPAAPTKYPFKFDNIWSGSGACFGVLAAGGHVWGHGFASACGELARAAPHAAWWSNHAAKGICVGEAEPTGEASEEPRLDHEFYAAVRNKSEEAWVDQTKFFDQSNLTLAVGRNSVSLNVRRAWWSFA